MDLLNDLFSKCDINNTDIENSIKKNLQKIIDSYINNIEIDFTSIEKTNNQLEIDFLERNGSEIITKEIQKYDEFVNKNDVDSILEYYIRSIKT